MAPIGPDPSSRSTRIGPYELLDELGRGGMGRVFRARHVQTAAIHAIKLVTAAPADAEAAGRRLARFRREVEVLARVGGHPGVVAIHSVGIAGGQPWCAMELVEGETLHQRLRHGRFPPADAVALVAEIARALDFVHGHGVVHRDLKPENILIGADGRPRVSDFGLAYDVFDDALTRSGALLGTPAFMPPEQVARDRRTDSLGAAADVYGLGALLYACLTARPPVEGEGLALLNAVLTQVPDPPSDHAPGVSSELDALCLRALEKCPADRPASALELASALEALRGSAASASASGLAREIGRIGRFVRRPRTQVAAVLLVLLGGALTAWALVAGDGASRGPSIAALVEEAETDLEAGRVRPATEIRALSGMPGLADDAALARRVELVALVAAAARGESVEPLADLVEGRPDLDARAVRALRAARALPAVLDLLARLGRPIAEPGLRNELAAAILAGTLAPPRDPTLCAAIARAPGLSEQDGARVRVAGVQAALAAGTIDEQVALDVFIDAVERRVYPDDAAWPDSVTDRLLDAFDAQLAAGSRSARSERAWAVTDLVSRAHRGPRPVPDRIMQGWLDSHERSRKTLELDELIFMGMLASQRWGRAAQDAFDWGRMAAQEPIVTHLTAELAKEAGERRSAMILLLALMRSPFATPESTQPILDEAASVVADSLEREGLDDDRWTLRSLGYLFALRGELDEAIALLERAHEVDRSLPEACRWPAITVDLAERLRERDPASPRLGPLLIEALGIREATEPVRQANGPGRPPPEPFEVDEAIARELVDLADRLYPDGDPVCCEGNDDRPPLDELIDRVLVHEGGAWMASAMYVRARHARRHGRTDEELRVTEAAIDRATEDISLGWGADQIQRALLIPAHRRRAEILRERGRTEAAERDVARAAEIAAEYRLKGGR